MQNFPAFSLRKALLLSTLVFRGKLPSKRKLGTKVGGFSISRHMTLIGVPFFYSCQITAFHSQFIGFFAAIYHLPLPVSTVLEVVSVDEKSLPIFLASTDEGWQVFAKTKSKKHLLHTKKD